ncbi:hypothetical protein [Micromonospora humi]|uniref:Uncharacterized protein n=1 Tax=Micromonospora humi TaxID=745366 RepID=A0A1C5IS19_9ACTN|nr:hypothetical protein [Micromonospora humi]SCG60566.1 hypothetical protein GA0070213_106360 [Micromonospora humi]
MCYIEVTASGSVRFGIDQSVYERAAAGQSRLFAVWPGQWSSDLFAIDDLDQLARGMGWAHDESRTGLADHDHQIRWSRLDRLNDNPRSPYVWVEVWLDCRCVVRDLRVFAAHMRRQLAWNIATSSGWGSSGSEGRGYSYSVKVQRRTLTQP